jgi:pantoate kinase
MKLNARHRADSSSNADNPFFTHIIGQVSGILPKFLQKIKHHRLQPSFAPSFFLVLYSQIPMKFTAKAFAPGNISCIFKIHQHPDPEKMGSYGLGFTVNKGVAVEAVLSPKTEIYFNKKKMNFPTVKSVIKKLIRKEKVKINITSDLPLGSGFGLSGASSLAAAYALNHLLDLKHTNLELAKIAHVAEVENRTGLGDVVNQYFGGFLVKLKPSSEFKVEKIPLENTSVYCKYFSQLSTKAVLSNPKIKQTINASATNTLEKVYKLIKQDATTGRIKFSDLIVISKEFAQKSGLLTNKKVIATIEEIESAGGQASMIMLGNAVFSNIPFEGAEELKISNTPAYLL